LKRDAIVGLVCLVGSVILYSTLDLIEDPRAITFPRTVITIMGILSALLLIQGLVMKVPGGEKSLGYPWLRFLLLFGLIVVYLAVSETLGFYLSAFLFFVTVTYVMGRADLSPKKAATRALGSAVFTGVLFILFSVLLEVQTPRGLLF
jgi:Tripartite tricarboxylate transporter TctB family